MIEFRWKQGAVFIPGISVRVLQYRLLFIPHLIASGDIVLRACTPEEAVWVDVPTVIGEQT